MTAPAPTPFLGGLRAARPADVPAMAELINGYAAQGLMLPKTEDALYAAVRNYAVVVDPAGRLAACGGLRVYSADSAEIVGLAVQGGWRGRGLGGRIVDHLVGEARRMNIHRLFAMTLSREFFGAHGFSPVLRATLPEKERADCDACPRRVGCREVAVQRVVLEGREVPAAGVSVPQVVPLLRRRPRRPRVPPAAAPGVGEARA